MNNPNAWFQFALYVGALLLITKPLGLYLVQVLDVHGKTCLDPVVKPFERLTYRVCGIDPGREQGWIGYTIAMLLFSLVGMLFTSAAQPAAAARRGASPRLQHRGEFHDQHQLAELCR